MFLKQPCLAALQAEGQAVILSSSSSDFQPSPTNWSTAELALQVSLSEKGRLFSAFLLYLPEEQSNLTRHFSDPPTSASSVGIYKPVTSAVLPKGSSEWKVWIVWLRYIPIPGCLSLQKEDDQTAPSLSSPGAKNKANKTPPEDAHSTAVCRKVAEEHWGNAGE